MKTLLLLLASLISIQNFTQTAFIDINNINATVETKGILFNEYDTYKHGFEALKGEGTHTIYSTSLWMAGLDASNQIKASIGNYGLPNESYTTGPLSIIAGSETDSTFGYGPATISPVVAQSYNNIYCITAAEVNEFISWYACDFDQACGSGTSFPNYAIPSSILNWPAHGDVSAGQDLYLAPFVDVNGDQIYNPADGDYPCIKGDKYAWIITNDKNPNNTTCDPIGVEIHTEIYAYVADISNPLSRTIFVSHDIINRSSQQLNDFYIGVLTDFDIGCNTDDYIGSIPELNSFFGYNAYSTDQNCAPNNYSNVPPAQSTTFLNTELSHSLSMLVGSSSYNGTPTTPQEYYNYLQGKFKDGSNLFYGGDGHNTSSGVTANSTNFQYPQNPPSGSPNWTETTNANQGGDRIMVGSVGPYLFSPGMKIELDLAYIYSRTALGNNLSSVIELESEIPIVQDYYDNLVSGCYNGGPVSVNENEQIEMSVYPNPFSEHLTFSSPDLQEIESFEFTDIYGRIIKKGFLTQTDSKTINTSDLPTGLYFLIFLNKSQKVLATHKLIKK